MHACSVVVNSLSPHGLQLASLLCPWDSSGKDTGMGCHFLLQGIFPTQGLNLGLLHCWQILYHLGHLGSPREQCKTLLSSLPKEWTNWERERYKNQKMVRILAPLPVELWSEKHRVGLLRTWASHIWPKLGLARQTPAEQMGSGLAPSLHQSRLFLR